MNDDGRAVIGIGTDLVDIDRFRTVINRTPAVIARLFTAGERSYAARATDAAPRLAGRFAAKEATLKALGLGLGAMAMAQIEVVRLGDGRPELLLHGPARAVARSHGVQRWLVTISHTDRLAQAIVMAL